MSYKNANEQKCLEVLKDHLDLGLITADQANVQMVRNERFRVITKLSREVRSALNKAVKAGELGHMKKDGLLPEIYYHPSFKYLADAERRRVLNNGIEALKSICI